jgi:PAS domain S-box-containing protein
MSGTRWVRKLSPEERKSCLFGWESGFRGSRDGGILDEDNFDNPPARPATRFPTWLDLMLHQDADHETRFVMTTQTVDELVRENEQLRRRLEEAEETVRALRAGEVDAVVVENGHEQVYTLELADRPYQLLVAQLPNAAAVLSVDGRILVCNRRFAELLDVSTTSLNGCRLKDYMAPDNWSALESLLRDGRIIPVQDTLTLLPDGREPLSMHFGVSSLRGGALGQCLLLTDVTDQHQYEELRRTQKALRESERYFREMIDALPVAIYTTDAQGRLTYFNPAAVEFSGRKPELGTDQWCVTWKLFHADGSPMAHDECPMAVALKEGRIVQNVEAIAERPDGRRIWFTPYPTALRDADGRIVGGINMLLDITERKRAEKAVGLLSAIVDCSDDAIVSKDLNGTITSWNKSAERLFGYSADEAVGKSVTMLIPKDRLDEEPEIITRLKSGERVDHFDTVRVRKDGSQFDISLTISPVRDSQGRVVGASKIARDITERKKAEAALHEADRRKDEFLATLAHELRGPLAPMRNAVSILLTKGPPVPELDSARGVIDRQLQIMTRLLEDLLDVTRISRNKLELRSKPVLLSTVIDSALETSRPVIEASKHSFAVELPPEPIHLDADPVRLAQVFSNLLTNAAKYTEEGGRISLSATRQGSDVLVTVKDSGIGISPEMLPRIFEIFSQSPRALERAQGGLGIGLSLVKGLVELHGGSVSATSEGAGRGSEFVVRLPISATTPTADSRRSKGVEKPPTTPSRRILVVDDNVDSADTLTQLLSILGHEVNTAYDGEAAVAAAEAMRPDVVLLDIGMPKLDGYEACRRIRKSEWGKKMFLIALTGWGQAEDRIRTRDAGFNHHLVKPVDAATLMKLLASVPV